jgi:hypothetical protein
VTDDLGVLPIEPGSHVDAALDAVVAHLMGKGRFKMDAFQLISMGNPQHMLALGTRVWCFKAGVRRPDDLVSTLYRQWYGQGATHA